MEEKKNTPNLQYKKGRIYERWDSDEDDFIQSFMNLTPRSSNKRTDDDEKGNVHENDKSDS